MAHVANYYASLFAGIITCGTRVLIAMINVAGGFFVTHRMLGMFRRQDYMANSIPLIAWLIAGVCFILSLGGLSQHETSRRGNILGVIGITIAILATLFSGMIGEVPEVSAGASIAGYTLLILALGVGGAIGIYLANRVEMTEMPQLVAILHSFVGLAAVLVGLSNSLYPLERGTRRRCHTQNRSVLRNPDWRVYVPPVR